MKYVYQTLLLLGLVSSLSARQAPNAQTVSTQKLSTAAPSPREVGRRLSDIQVKHLSFRNAQIEDVIEQLATLARESNPPVNIVYRPTQVQRAPLNLDLRDKSLRQILQLVCKVSELQIQVRNGIVFVGDPV